MPATKSALRGSQSAVPATKSALQGSPTRAVPATKSAPRGSQSAVLLQCYKICTSRFTKCRACHEICTSRLTIQVLRRPHFDVHKMLCLPRKWQTSHMSKSHDSLHLSRNQSSSKITAIVQSAVPATKAVFRSKAAPIPCTCHEKSTLDQENTRFPSCLPRKVSTMCENVHGATTRAQSRQAPAAGTQILRACAVGVHVDDFERHQCIR